MESKVKKFWRTGKIKSRFESVGLYTPEEVYSTEETVDLMKKEAWFDLQDMTGIETRHVRSALEDSFTIGRDAIKSCLTNSDYNASDLDVLIYSGITGFNGAYNFHFEPTFSLLLKEELDFGEAMNFDITNACAGMPTGLYLLDSLIKDGVVENGMVVSGECITPIAETAIKEISDPIDDQLASLTVGDAGSAFILEESTEEKEGIEFAEFITLSDFADLCFGMPSDENPGVAMYTKAAEIHDNTLERFPVIVDKTLNKYGVSITDYDYIIPHPTAVAAVKRASNALEGQLGVEEDGLPEWLHEVKYYGNTSSTTHYVTLYNKVMDGTIEKGSKVLFLSFASGIVIGVISATISDLEVKDGS